MITRPAFTLHDLLSNAAAHDPERLAIIDGENTFSYAELVRGANALAAALLDAGVQKGDRVGIYLEKSFEAVVAMLAASQAGAAFVNLNPLLKPRQVHHIVRDCDIRILIADPNRLASLEPRIVQHAFSTGDALPEMETADALTSLSEVLSQDVGRRPQGSVLETDLATIIYTSGSTGLPKGVTLSQRNLVVGAQIVSTYLENTPDDRILSVLPFSFDYGLNQLTTALRVGATLVLQRSSLPGDLLRSLREHRITGLAGVPPLWSLLLTHGRNLEEYPLPHLRYITNSGGRIPPTHLEQLRRRLPDTRIYLMYGLTEAFRSTYVPPEESDRRTDCIGKPIPNTEIWVLDDAGRPCAPGQVGQLVHRGPTVALGYWGKEEESRTVFRANPFAPEGTPGHERVVFSGDLVWRDEDGYLYFVGREDALIKTQGYRVSPEEVEDLLVGTGLVREACAFGVDDPEAGQRIVAVVSLWGGQEASIERIRACCLANGPAYLVPRVIEIVRELPKTPTGKIDRKAVSNVFAAR